MQIVCINSFLGCCSLGAGMGEEIGLMLDGSAILLVAMGLWLSLQRRRWAGVLFGVVGLAVMSGSAALRAYPNPTRTALQQTADELRAKVGEITGEWQRAEADREVLKRDAARLRNQVDEAEARLGREIENERLLAEKIEKLGRELAQERGETHKARSDMLLQLKRMMSEGLSTKFYRIAVLPDRELITGKVGTYFSIRLKDEAAGTQFIFPKGRYTIQASEVAIAEAARRLQRDVLSVLDSLLEYQLFARGGADAEPLAGLGDLLPDYSTIAYMPVGDGGKYASETVEQSFHTPIANNNLPLLRAAYFRSIVASKISAGRIDVLYNLPSKQVAEEYRTVELILYFK